MNFVFYLHDEFSVDVFEKKLLWFKKKYDLISYDELYESIYYHKRLNNTCHLTIDDGWLSTYRIVFPLMKKYGIPFTIFVSPEVCRSERNFWFKDMLGIDENWMRERMIDKGFYKKGIERFSLGLLFKEIPIDSVYQLLDEYWESHDSQNRQSRGFVNVNELKEMSDSGLVEIGAHTLTHPILALENGSRSEYEIKESIIQLSEILDKQITAFAYPNGLSGLDFTYREMDIVKKVGIKMAFSVDPGIVNSKVSPFAIPRIGSKRRLQLGHLGALLPSLARQIELRKEIRKYLVR